MVRYKLAICLTLLESVLLLCGRHGGAADPDWPRQIDVPAATIVVYQPQPESFRGNILTGRMAVAVTPRGRTNPFYGTVWASSRVETNRDQRTVTIADLTVARMTFPNATAQQQQELSQILEREFPQWNLTFSLDRLEASLLNAQVEQASVEGLRTAPPRILIAREPSILVSIDGAPQLRPIENSLLQRVVNTPLPLLFDPDTDTYYLNGGMLWYSAPQVKGPWTLIESPPAAVAAVVPQSQNEAATTSAASGPAPRILIATGPTELIVTDGPPQYASILGTSLLYMTNTESDVILDTTSQHYYVLLSGRWFRSPSLDGTWSFVPPNELPNSFQMIPPQSARGDVRSHVAGTDEARIAVVDSQIPQTAAIPRGETNLNMEYDGPPHFESIPGTGIEYAVNTSSSVLKIHSRYYACEQGAWYVAPSPTGPWTVATAVPPEVQSIPPNCSLYNTRYVYVYQSMPSVVYVGYTPGYLGCYPFDGVVVWGTGFYYTPWVGAYYYARPATWGFHARYYSWTGWTFGLSYNTGPFSFDFGWGGPHYTFYRGGWWGPGGYRGPAYVNVRNRWIRFNRPDGRNHNLYHRQGGITPERQAYRRQPAVVPRPAPARANDVFSYRNGDVYRRTGSGWQERGRSGWTPSPPNRSGRPSGARTPRYPAPRQPRVAPAPGGSFTPRVLEPDYRAREMGRSREQGFRNQGFGGRPGGFGSRARGGSGGRSGGGSSGTAGGSSGGGGRRR